MNTLILYNPTQSNEKPQSTKQEQGRILTEATKKCAVFNSNQICV